VLTIEDPLLKMTNCKFVDVDCLDKYTSINAELCNPMIVSQSGKGPVPVKRTTATIVSPPFVAIFKVRAPALRYCDLARLKVTWPLPCGPPDALYTGRMTDPTGSLARVDMDAKEGFAATRAKNLAQTVLEYPERTQFAVLPAGELELDGQVMHVELAEAPASVEYVPAPQSVQTADPVQDATNPDLTSL
jgi:hypothetical protein